MFAVEIDFHDGISPPETILVRRSNAIIGSSDVAHVVIEGAASSVSELRLVRGLGREFSCYPVRRPGQSSSPPPFLEGTYIGQADVRLGDLTLHITALDVDLLLGSEEFPDRGAMRILRAAATRPSPLFPALAVLGPRPMFVSFPPDESILVGRSRKCGLRLDSPDVSNEHARIGVRDGVCWVEDVGSTNGTFIGSERISGRQTLDRGARIRLGAEFALAPVLSETDFATLTEDGGFRYPEQSDSEEYPCVLAYGAEVRPARCVLREGAALSLGRDPASDIWINAAHISRTHLHLKWYDEGRVQLVDRSSNGTFVEGKRLERDVPLLLERELLALDLSEGVFVGICFNEADEKFFLEGETRRPAEGPLAKETLRPEAPISGAAAGVAAAIGAAEGSEMSAVQTAEPEEFSAPPRTSFSSEQREEASEHFLRESFPEYSGPGPSRQFVDENELFEDELFDDELLQTPYFKGASRLLLAVLIVVLVVCTLVLFIGVFTDARG